MLDKIKEKFEIIKTTSSYVSLNNGDKIYVENLTYGAVGPIFFQTNGMNREEEFKALCSSYELRYIAVKIGAEAFEECVRIDDKGKGLNLSCMLEKDVIKLSLDNVNNKIDEIKSEGKKIIFIDRKDWELENTEDKQGYPLCYLRRRLAISVIDKNILLKCL